MRQNLDKMKSARLKTILTKKFAKEYHAVKNYRE